MADEGYVTTHDGVRLFYRTLGGGPPVLVVPNGLYLLDDLRPLAVGRTILAYDPRNRGRSDRVAERGVAVGSMEREVADLEAIRAHFRLDRMDLLGHSYAGMLVVLYAMEHPRRVGRLVQMSPLEPHPGKSYPDHPSPADGVVEEAMRRLAELQAEVTTDPEERCRRFWSVLRRIYVADPTHAEKIDWGRCHLPNERAFLSYWTQSLLPSIRALALTPERLAAVRAPVLVVHGRQDRSAPYGGAREWAALLPDARLVTIEGAAHAPWIEAPEPVLAVLATFLAGGWPANACSRAVRPPA